jgi:carboxypeptidase PM20D1
VAVIGTAEKGALSLWVSAVDDEADPVSAPRSAGALARVARAIARLEEQPFPARIRGPTREFLLTLGPRMDPGTRMLVANLWLLERPVAAALGERRDLEAAVRTTVTAMGFVTEGAEREAPTGASALLHLGVAPWDSPGSVLAEVRERLADLDVEVTPQGEVPPIPPSPESSATGEGFRLLRRAAFRTFPDVAEAPPGLVPVPTEGRHYEPVAADVYRFVPIRMDGEIERSLGSADERIRVSAYLDMIRFYGGLLEEGAG